jgi:hypothetical protein
VRAYKHGAGVRRISRNNSDDQRAAPTFSMNVLPF